ncbi:MAG: family 43 glycosylhydrolase [Clostridia bacterium]|nr:family 43 glycosylhydrolase [Clostridia bacterium]
MNFKKTYCNPLKIENYPKGYEAPSHRSLADPSVLFYDGKWYMYPSYQMAYVSEDFINWEHKKIEPCDIGYAPTIVVHRGKIYLYGKNGKLYVADNPLGPFEELGPIKHSNGTPLNATFDPMIFSDDDERAYIYYSLIDRSSGKTEVSIWGIELDSEDLTRTVGEQKCLIKFDNTHKWECYGERNQDTSLSWIEGAWMIKKNGRYYLTYSAPGTQYGTYAMGAYYSDKGALEGFVYQKNNPICNNRYGLVRGGGHGCICEGPNDTLWAFYTCPVKYTHMFERCLGMDPVAINEDGELMVLKNTDFPQWAPGVKENPYYENDTGLSPLTYSETASATSNTPGRDALYAVDESMLTWWQPADDDSEKTLTVSLYGKYFVSAARVIWRDVGLDYENGVLPGPIKYKIEVSKDRETWETVVDKTQNSKDYMIDYEVFDTVEAMQVRLIICGAPNGITPGVISFTVFGKHGE